MQDRVPQARLYKVWGAPTLTSTDAEYLNLFGDVLAGGKNSRLFERLVYNDQVATSAQAGMVSMEIGGMFWVVVTAPAGGDLAAVERAMNEEIERLLEEGIEEDELERVEVEQRAGLGRGRQRVGGLGGKSDLLGENAVHEGQPGPYTK